MGRSSCKRTDWWLDGFGFDGTGKTAVQQLWTVWLGFPAGLGSFPATSSGPGRGGRSSLEHWGRSQWNVFFPREKNNGKAAGLNGGPGLLPPPGDWPGAGPCELRRGGDPADLLPNGPSRASGTGKTGWGPDHRLPQRGPSRTSCLPGWAFPLKKWRKRRFPSTSAQRRPSWESTMGERAIFALNDTSLSMEKRNGDLQVSLWRVNTGCCRTGSTSFPSSRVIL